MAAAEYFYNYPSSIPCVPQLPLILPHPDSLLYTPPQSSNIIISALTNEILSSSAQNLRPAKQAVFIFFLTFSIFASLVNLLQVGLNFLTFVV